MGPLTTPISPNTTSSINLQFKSRKKSEERYVDQIIAVSEKLVPTLLIIFELGVDNKKSEIVEVKYRGRSTADCTASHAHYDDYHYNIIVYGCSSKSFGAIPPQAEEMYQEILQTPNAIADFPRQANLEALDQLNPSFSGTQTYGSPEWEEWVLGEDEGLRHIKAAYDLGIQTFDTANVYSNGLSEVILGKAIKKFNLPRDEIVVMTKVYFGLGHKVSEKFVAGGGYPNEYGLSRKHIFESIKHSLERLQLDYVDILQCHRFDNDTPIAETMQALHDVVKAGYARYIGMSSCHAYQFHAMQNYAITNKLTPFISMQNHYSLVYREEEREMMPTLKMFGVGSIPWSPLARGFLTRPLGQQTHRAEKDWFFENYSKAHEGNNEIVRRVEAVAKKKGASMAQVALAWCMSKDPVAAPIVGTTSLKNLEDLVAAIDVKLTEEEVGYLEEPYAPQSILGHM
ncbi:aldo/keto reductase family protein [Ceratobasidium sp. AG-Ba]|nr:aldo/keto reductase family protein [Ceratobasidium sp. AG-Ba]